MDEPDRVTCPHVFAVRVETGGWTQHSELGCYVHGDPDCMRPSRQALRKIAEREGLWDGMGAEALHGSAPIPRRPTASDATPPGV